MSDTTRGRSAFGLTASGRGWYKRIPGGKVKWITSFGNAPTAAEADRTFAEKYGDLTSKAPAVDAVTLKYACEAVLETKANPHTHKDAKAILQQFCDSVGDQHRINTIGPAEFTAFAKVIAGYSLIRRNKIVGVVRSLFNWCIAQQWITTIHYGPVFVQPSKREMRIDRANRPKKLFTTKQIRTLVDKADPMTAAAVLLGINGGMGPADISGVRRDMIDGDLLRADRGKTGATRIIPLWPETRKALKALHADTDGRLFYGRAGVALESLNNRGLVRRFTDLCDACKVPRHGFYTLRRTFRTVTDILPDRRAVDLVMGHVQEDMGGHYVQEVHPDRLRAVTSHVLEWLASPAATASSVSKTALASARKAAAPPASRPTHAASTATRRRVSNPE